MGMLRNPDIKPVIIAEGTVLTAGEVEEAPVGPAEQKDPAAERAAEAAVAEIHPWPGAVGALVPEARPRRPNPAVLVEELLKSRSRRDHGLPQDLDRMKEEAQSEAEGGGLLRNEAGEALPLRFLSGALSCRGRHVARASNRYRRHSLPRWAVVQVRLRRHP